MASWQAGNGWPADGGWGDALTGTGEEAKREEIFLGLRLSTGVAEERIAEIVALGEDPLLREDYERWLTEGVLRRSRDRVCFTERGYLVSNEVLSRFV